MIVYCILVPVWSHDTNAVAVDDVDAVKNEDLQTMYLNASMKVYISTYVVLHVCIMYSRMFSEQSDH